MTLFDPYQRVLTIECESNGPLCSAFCFKAHSVLSSQFFCHLSFYFQFYQDMNDIPNYKLFPTPSFFNQLFLYVFFFEQYLSGCILVLCQHCKLIFIMRLSRLICYLLQWVKGYLTMHKLGLVYRKRFEYACAYAYGVYSTL